MTVGFYINVIKTKITSIIQNNQIKMKKKFKNIASFFERARERPFNDALSHYIAVEIKIKGQLNENIILPRYYNKSVIVDGITYKKSATPASLLPKKALEEVKELVILGGKQNLKNYTEIKMWLVKKMEISYCHFFFRDIYDMKKDLKNIKKKVDAKLEKFKEFVNFERIKSLVFHA